MEHNDHPAPPPGFLPIEYIQCTSLLSQDGAAINIAKTRERGTRPFFGMDGYLEPRDHPIAIVAGGPSLAYLLDDLRLFKTIMACGSVHDYLVEQGIVPTYCVITDPQACHVDFLKLPQKKTVYLVDSRVDPAVFDHLEGYDVRYWNATGEAPPEAFAGEPSYGWGAFAALKAISLAIFLGFADHHFFGLDSCYMPDGKTHAYDYDDTPYSDSNVDLTVMVEGSGMFRSSASLVAQAQQFFRLGESAGNYFRPTVYGRGLIAEMIRVGPDGPDAGKLPIADSSAAA